jgi:predicted aldo/keto reductase-like oxidoreductase
MRYSEFGKTGKRVSAIGFGGMRFNLKDAVENNAGLLQYAFDKGINYFDTAPGYCEDKSEEIFGLAFQKLPRDKYFVATKLMPMHVVSAAEAYEKVIKSIDRMGVGYIDFFHVWCIRRMEQFDQAINDGLYEALLKCKAEGLIKHIAFSSHQEGSGVRKVIESGLFEGVLMGINILNFPYRWDGVLAAKEHGLGVVAMNPLAGGLIPQNEDKLQFLASPGETPTQAALRFLVANPNITVALNGFTTREHIDAACRAADAEPMTEEDIARIKSHISKNMTRICTACGYCEECPQNIPIPSYMQIYNDKAVFGKSDEELIESMDFHHNWGLLAEPRGCAAACIACGRCEESCTQHLNITERLKEIAGWEAKSQELNKEK